MEPRPGGVLSLRRDPEKAREWQRRSKALERTGRLAPMSERRRRLLPARRRAVEAVRARDGDRCAAAGLDMGPCFGVLTPHETLTRARSGRDENLIDPAGIVLLCVRHNEGVSNTWRMQRRAYEVGLLRHSTG